MWGTNRQSGPLTVPTKLSDAHLSSLVVIHSSSSKGTWIWLLSANSKTSPSLSQLISGASPTARTEQKSFTSFPKDEVRFEGLSRKCPARR